jgi:hypothetical protein
MTNDISQVSKDFFHSKALPAKIDYEKLLPYFAFSPHDVIHHTLKQTTQLGKSKIHYPKRCHLKSRFQNLRNKMLKQLIATDTFFANEKSVEGYHCAREFFGMISEMVYGINTESEFADVHLDFLRKCGVPSTLQRDHAKYEISQ